MNIPIRKVLIVAIAATFSGFAMPTLAHAEPGITLGLDYGRAEARKFCSNVADCSSDDDTFKGEIGFEFNDYFSAELGYTSLGTLFDSNDNQFQASQDSSAITLSGIGTFAINDRFGIYGRLGAAHYKTDSTGTVAGVPVEDQDGVSPLWGLGIRVGLSDNFALRAEFQSYSDISRVDGRKDDVQAMYAGVLFKM
ncbi:MAG: outer membrane beta-barrel protein [Moraxellaceae bacterium]|nr:outer membrane beta-barrel protein [Moraxellaceae bacterium]